MFVEETTEFDYSPGDTINILKQQKVREGWQDGLEVCTVISKLSSLDLNLGPALNCHPGVSSMCAVSRMDVKLSIPSVSIS